VLLVYEHDAMDVSQKLTRIEHDAFHRIVASMHVHMDEENCLEIVVLKGAGKEVRAMGEKLLSLRGIKYGKLSMGTTGQHVH